MTNYDYGIYNNGLATKVVSNNYSEKSSGPKYETPIFRSNKDGSSPYKISCFIS